MKNLAIIPARSGSKGIPDKNIKKINGRPLIAYTIEAAVQSGLFTEVFVSTDSENYKSIAEGFGASIPFLRPIDLSGDESSSWDVVKEALQRYKEIGIQFDNVVLLQPTSPLRDSTDIQKAYHLFIDKNANMVTSVCEVEHSPLWSNTLDTDLCMYHFINRDLINNPRQKLDTYYRINGAIYIVKVEHLMNSKELYDQQSFAFVMSKEKSVDIDDMFDFKIAERLLEEIG